MELHLAGVDFFFLKTFNGNDLQLCHAVVLNCARRFDSFMLSFRSLMCTQKQLVSGIADHMDWRWGQPALVYRGIRHSLFH